MKINNLVKNPRWKISNPKCTCKGKLDDCIHCKYSKAEQSIPTENFKMIESVYDKDGKRTAKKLTKTISEINIITGSHQDVQGWTWQ